MAVRKDIEERLVVEGVPFVVRLVESPTIEDVVATEARLHASKIEGYPIPFDHQVERDVRDFLIRLGIDR